MMAIARPDQPQEKKGRNLTVALALAIALVMVLLMGGCISPASDGGANRTLASDSGATHTPNTEGPVGTLNAFGNDDGLGQKNSRSYPAQQRNKSAVEESAPKNMANHSNWVESDDTNQALFDRFPYVWWDGPNFSGRARARLRENDGQKTDGRASNTANSSDVLIEFMDYDCLHCAYSRNLTIAALAFHPDLALEYRHFPLPQMAYSRQAALGAECAADQGKFWDYSNALMEDQVDLTFEKLYRLAGQAGVDNLTLWAICTKSQWHADVLSKDYNESQKYGVNATPTFVLNGNVMVGHGQGDEFRQWVEAALANKSR